MSDRSPCSVEAEAWRECLKGYDYMPDSGRETQCDAGRKLYYQCLGNFRSQTSTPPDHISLPFKLRPECGLEGEKFYSCMSQHAFDYFCCKDQMCVLRKCVARYDPEVAALLAEDEQSKASLEDAKGQPPRKLGTFWGYLTGQ